MMINYDAVFFSQGVVDQLYFKPMMRTRNEMAKTVWAPVMVLLGILLYALSSPQNYSQTGFLFFYPLYSDYTIQCLYTSGTWMWIYFIAWTMHHIANKKFNEATYRLLTGSSLYAYLSHYFFIILIAVVILRPYKIDFVPALAIEMVLTNFLILVTYLIFNFFYELVIPPKKRDQKTPMQEQEEQRALLKNQEVTVENKAR
uniref:Acyltransferase 3 domain-containing protein n=1 Tax=Strombidium rassoulzadegani TaxID=1082188 RepID=A0A7S3FUF9_9SPIT|mmetsp:Transcript_13236/g.22460  ORF Transcript_13236/g.22460 Transcript_13236/m.22460 type:complete len:201 (+) Transcript_13236:1005-1607(+)